VPTIARRGPKVTKLNMPRDTIDGYFFSRRA